jgi:hypothetical protein
MVLGAGLFATNALVNERTAGDRVDRIVIAQGRVEHLAALFERTRQRPPTADELRDIVDDEVLDEALYREGLALGLDRDDSVIRRRVRQKLEFVVDDVVGQVEPGTAELEAWLTEHDARYAQPARTSFRQVYLDPARRGEEVRADAERLLAELSAGTHGADVRALGDRTLIEHAHAQVSSADVARDFGQAFADALADLPEDAWSGPVSSAYGLHLVHVDARAPGRAPLLAEVRAEVERDWLYAEGRRASQRFHEQVLARYEVSIEWPPGQAVGAATPAEHVPD